MSWKSRLLCVIALALHLAAPVSAYVVTAAGPDFGALCSVLRPLVPAGPGARAHVPAGTHVLHCPLCGGAIGAAMPAPSVPMLATVAPQPAPVVLATASVPDIARLTPQARGPPRSS